VPYGQTLEEFLAQVRTFHTVFPHVRVNIGPGGWGFYMIGSDQPVEFDPATMKEVLARPGIRADISSAPDLGGRTPEDLVDRIQFLTWLKEDQVDRVVGSGPSSPTTIRCPNISCSAVSGIRTRNDSVFRSLID